MRITERIVSKSIRERFLSVWTISITLFLFTTVVSFFLIPQGLLRKVLPSSILLGGLTDPLETFMKIFLFNLFIGGFLYSTICNFFRVGRIPLGYFAVWLSITIVGLIEGTNSFLYPYANIYASLVGFLRTGLWEYTAYVLMTISTANIFLYRQTSWTNWETTKVRGFSEIELGRKEKAVCFLGIVVLAIAALTETLAIFGFLE